MKDYQLAGIAWCLFVWLLAALLILWSTRTDERWDPDPVVVVDTVEVPTGTIRSEAFDMVCYFTNEEES